MMIKPNKNTRNQNTTSHVPTKIETITVSVSNIKQQVYVIINKF